MGITIVQKSDLTVRKKNAKVALVLAGGAISGGSYKMGGLKALNDLIVNRDVTDFDVFVGLSAGAFIAGPLASGVTVEEMLKSIDGKSDRISQLSPLDFYNPNIGEFIAKPLDLLYDLFTVFPKFAVNATAQFFSADHAFPSAVARFAASPTYKNLDRVMKILVRIIMVSKNVPSLMSYLPSGLFDNRRIEGYVRRNMQRNGLKNTFADVYDRRRKELYITAMNLDTARQEIFGYDENNSLTISEATQASTALPIFYKPARIKGVDYVDGGVTTTANINVAVKHGASLIICYNPFRPFENRLLIRWYKELDQYVADKKHLADGGLTAVINQAFRTLLHYRLHSTIQRLEADPNFRGDILLIEPSVDDISFFEINPLAFWERAKAAEHGYLSVKESIGESYPAVKRIFNAYGMETTMLYLQEATGKIASSQADETIIGVLGKENLKRDIRLAM
jgi:predicted acylesterase/phospholipase RssA